MSTETIESTENQTEQEQKNVKICAVWVELKEKGDGVSLTVTHGIGDELNGTDFGRVTEAILPIVSRYMVEKIGPVVEAFLEHGKKDTDNQPLDDVAL